nr:hypothetical protein [Clostridium perfringens]
MARIYMKHQNHFHVKVIKMNQSVSLIFGKKISFLKIKGRRLQSQLLKIF